MYLHLGREVVVRIRDVVGIFDMETATVGRITPAFFRASEQALRITSITDELPKSFVVTVENGVERVYLSQIAASTLEKRVESGGVTSGGWVLEED